MLNTLGILKKVRVALVLRGQTAFFLLHLGGEKRSGELRTVFLFNISPDFDDYVS